MKTPPAQPQADSSTADVTALAGARPAAQQATPPHPPHPATPHHHTSVSVDQMQTVLEVSRKLAVTSELIPLLDLICRSASSVLSAERSSIFVHDPENNTLWTKVAMGTGEIRVPSTAGIVGMVFTSRELLNIPDAYAHPKFNQEVDKRTGFRTRNLLTAPMFDVTDRCVGVLQVVNKTGGPFSPTDELLAQLLADQAGVAIQRYQLMKQAVKNAELQREMDVAQRVQQALIPIKPPKVDGLEVVGWTQPASVTGGDTYDIWTLDDGRLGVFLADASGHGVAPAIVVTQARTLVRTLTALRPTPQEVLAMVNDRLCDDLKDGMFVTAFFAIISPDGTMDWYSAGHGPVYYRPAPAMPLEELIPCSPPLGVVPFLPDEKPQPVKLQPGGQLILMTDGIYEAWSPQNELLGNERVLALLDRHRLDQVTDILTTVKQTVTDWQSGKEAKDDQTVVLVRKT